MATTKIAGFRKRRERVRIALRKRAGGRARLSIHRTGKNIYAQIVDDLAGRTIAAASTLDKELKGGIKSGSGLEAASLVGKAIAEKATKAGVTDVVFDRGGFLFHGRVKALADAAREGGLKF